MAELPLVSYAEPRQPEIIYRAEAQAQKLDRYFTGKPCPRGHLAERRTSNGNCLACLKRSRPPGHPPEPTRVAARAQGLPHYDTGRPCRNGHTSRRYVYNGQCMKCSQENATRYQKEHPEKKKEYALRTYQKHREKKIAHGVRYRAEHVEQYKAYYTNNKDRYRKYARARKKKIMIATPVWADLASIDLIYVSAARLTEETGIPHDVDHIVPLIGRNVRGLHVPWNLRVITRKENRAKGNRHE